MGQIRFHALNGGSNLLGFVASILGALLELLLEGGDGGLDISNFGLQLVLVFGGEDAALALFELEGDLEKLFQLIELVPLIGHAFLQLHNFGGCAGRGVLYNGVDLVQLFL